MSHDTLSISNVFGHVNIPAPHTKTKVTIRIFLPPPPFCARSINCVRGKYVRLAMYVIQYGRTTEGVLDLCNGVISEYVIQYGPTTEGVLDRENPTYCLTFVAR